MSTPGKKGSTSVGFTEDELKIIHKAAHSVWNYIAYDCIKAVEEEKGRGATMPRAEVIEMVADAGRLEDKLRQNKTDVNLIDRVRKLDMDEIEKVLKPAFPHSRYGM